MWRIEDKYACSWQEMRLLQARMGSIMASDKNQRDEQGYCITSVYFDDLYDTGYRDTVIGNSERRKYRIRIYNRSLKNIKLEVKYKRYNRVLKKAQLISEEQMRLLLQGQRIECEKYSYDDVTALFNMAISQNGLHPKIIVEYERKAYIYKSGNVRITFDRNIRTSNQTSLFGTDRISYSYLEEPNDILEVKYDEFLPGFIAQSLEIGNMIQTSYSKYVLSRERNMEECRQKM